MVLWRALYFRLRKAPIEDKNEWDTSGTSVRIRVLAFDVDVESLTPADLRNDQRSRSDVLASLPTSRVFGIWRYAWLHLQKKGVERGCGLGKPDDLVASQPHNKRLKRGVATFTRLKMDRFL